MPEPRGELTFIISEATWLSIWRKITLRELQSPSEADVVWVDDTIQRGTPITN